MRLVSRVFICLTLLPLAGCGLFSRPQRPAWRGQAEKACLATHQFTSSSVFYPMATINGDGICGLDSPFRLTALPNTNVVLNSAQTLGCPMVAALAEWVQARVQPAAQMHFGQQVVRINSMGSYTCRSMDNQWGANYSEHAFGNAMDVGGFVFADGGEISILKDWSAQDPNVQAFLRDVLMGACDNFTTVLGPGADKYHANHLHLDLAMHAMTRSGPKRYCRATPTILPNSTPVQPGEEELDVAQNGNNGSARADAQRGYSRGAGLALSTPPAPPPQPPRASYATGPQAALWR